MSLEAFLLLKRVMGAHTSVGAPITGQQCSLVVRLRWNLVLGSAFTVKL